MITALEFPVLDPAETLATEEILLDAAEDGITSEVLAFWESRRHFVVLGYGNKASTEVNLSACDQLGIPVLRRISGGGTVLQGPGVLNYCLVLRAAENTPLAGISNANKFIMQRNAAALTLLLSSALPPPIGWGAGRGEGGGKQAAALHVEVQGHTDLALAGRKFSGNAQRRKRTHLLFHGAILLHLDLNLLDATLPMPSLQPGYRGGRSHRNFLTQLNISATAVKDALCQAWSASNMASLDTLMADWRTAAAKLVMEKYSRDDWNLRA